MKKTQAAKRNECTKLHSAGNLQWSRQLGGPENDEEASSVTQINNGTIVVAGYTYSFAVGGKDAWLITLDINGNIFSQTRFGTAFDEYFSGIKKTSDGGYVIAGYFGGTRNGDGWILKFNSAHSVQWQITLGGNYSDSAFSVDQTPDGGFIGTGYSNRNASHYVTWLFKLDSAGLVLWNKLYYSSTTISESGYAVKITPDTGIVIAGNVRESATSQETDFRIYKTNGVGEIGGCSGQVDATFSALFPIITFGGTTASPVAGPQSPTTITRQAVGRTISTSTVCTGSSNPDFTLDCPSLLTASKNSSLTKTCTVTSHNGFTGAVALNCIGEPSGTTCAFSPTSANLTAGEAETVNLNLTVSNTTTPGDYDMHFEASSGDLTHISQLRLTVPVPDVAISCSPDIFTVEILESATSTCTVSSISGHTGQIIYSCANLPSHVQCQFNPTSGILSANGSLTTQLTISALTGAPPGTRVIQAAGQSASIGTRTTDLQLTIPPPDFALSCSPAAFSSARGFSANSTCTITSTSGFTTTGIDMSCESLPADVTCTFNPPSVNLPANGSITTGLSISVGMTALPGTYTIQAKADSSTSLGNRYFPVQLTVLPPDFNISCSPSSLTIVGGSSGNTTCTVGSVNSFSSLVNLSCSNLPSGVTCSYAPSSVTPPANGTIASTLTVNVGANAASGTYTFQARGISGSTTKTFNIQLTVVAPTFSLLCTPAALTIPVGSSKTTSCEVRSINNFNSIVNLFCLDLPAGTSCSFAPTSVTPPPNGTVTSVLTITVGNTSPGTYAIQAVATSGSITKINNMQITVPTPDDAAFVSQNVPVSMAAGQRYNVSARIRNTGSNTWTTTGYKLRSQSPQDNTRWGMNRVNLAAQVPSGSDAVFNFVVTAPTTPGTHNFQWRMLRVGVADFGQYTTLIPINVYATKPLDSAFVSQSIATVMNPGVTYTATVRMRNTGTNTWTLANADKLGSQNPQDNYIWNLSRVNVPSNVAPNGEVNFVFTVRAPSTPGTYNFQWRMLRVGVAWFGQFSPNLSITVVSP